MSKRKAYRLFLREDCDHDLEPNFSDNGRWQFPTP